jgi:hypothetical protein
VNHREIFVISPRVIAALGGSRLPERILAV